MRSVASVVNLSHTKALRSGVVAWCHFVYTSRCGAAIYATCVAHTVARCVDGRRDREVVCDARLAQNVRKKQILAI